MLYSNGLMCSGPYQKVLWSVSTPIPGWQSLMYTKYLVHFPTNQLVSRALRFARGSVRIEDAKSLVEKLKVTSRPSYHNVTTSPNCNLTHSSSIVCQGNLGKGRGSLMISRKSIVRVNPNLMESLPPNRLPKF